MVKIVTHSGGFHADDVFAVATAILSLEEDTPYEIVRSRDPEVIASADFVVDVGGEYDSSKKRFDHHQTDGAGVRDNGIPYAAFGLVWKEYGMKISGSEKIAQKIEQRLVMFVDALDNGKEISESIYDGIRPYTISDYLYSYWVDESVPEKEIDLVFKRVVSLAKDLIGREVSKAHRIELDEEVVDKIYQSSEDRRLIILDKHLAWGRLLVEKPEPLVVVYPSHNGTWYAKVVRKGVHSFENRVDYPEEWAGKSGEELAKLSGVSDAVFCHLGRFLAVAKSKDGAIALAKQVIK